MVNPAKRARTVIDLADDQATSCREQGPNVKNETDEAKPKACIRSSNPSLGKIKSNPIHIDPIAKVTQRSGVEVPKNWPVGLYFIGDCNASGGWPGPDKLSEFFFTHSVKVNKKVEIEISPKNRGLGLFAARKLRKGQVVGYYSGNMFVKKQSFCMSYEEVVLGM